MGRHDIKPSRLVRAAMPFPSDALGVAVAAGVWLVLGRRSDAIETGWQRARVMRAPDGSDVAHRFDARPGELHTVAAPWTLVQTLRDGRVLRWPCDGGTHVVELGAVWSIEPRGTP